MNAETKTRKSQLEASRKYYRKKDRINCLFDKGTIERINKVKKEDESIQGFIRRSVLYRIDEIEMIKGYKGM